MEVPRNYRSERYRYPPGITGATVRTDEYRAILVNGSAEAGVKHEENMFADEINYPSQPGVSYISLPLDNTFDISWHDRLRRFSGTYDSECRVREKYWPFWKK